MLLVVAVLAAVGTGASRSATLSVPGTDGKLVAVGIDLTNREFEHDGLYVANADGSGFRQITHSIADEQPHWSPDGNWIAFGNTRPDPNTVEVIHGDGSGRRALGAGNALDAPNPWSPDGARLAWGGCGGLCVLELASSGRRSISLGDDDGEGFSWSPDGRQLAAVDNNGRLVVVSADGSAKRVLSTVSAEAPAWSPDGTAIAFVERNGRRFPLAVVAAAGGPTRVLATTTGDGQIRWSPDGRSLLYTGDRGVRVIDVATGRDTLAVAGGASQGWAPDGSAIAYTRSRWQARGTEPDVWIAGTDGNGARQVTTAFPTGVQYDDADWTAGSLPPASEPPQSLLSLPATAQKQTDWVAALAPAGPGAGVAYEDAGVTCDYNAETTASVFNVWTPPATQAITTRTPCGNYDSWEPFGVTASLVGWTARAILSPSDYRPFAAVAHQGTAGHELARWTADSYDKRIGLVGDLGDLVGDGSLLVFETWGYKIRGHSVLTVHRWLWRIVNDHTPRLRGSRLPPDATDALAVDAGRIVVRTKHGLLLLNANGRVLRRLPSPKPDSARLGGDLLGAVNGSTLSVYSAGRGRLRYRLKLAHASGPPRLLSIRNGYAAYTSGIEVHLLRLRDRLDRVLDLPGQAGPADALLSPRGLFVSYNRAYDTHPGRIIYVPWPKIP